MCGCHVGGVTCVRDDTMLGGDGVEDVVLAGGGDVLGMWCRRGEVTV